MKYSTEWFVSRSWLRVGLVALYCATEVIVMSCRRIYELCSRSRA